MACMKIIISVTKVCGQLFSNYTYFFDSCFSGVKTYEEVISKVMDYSGLVKKSHKVFCLATLEKLIKFFPGGSHIFININPICTGNRTLMPIVYK